MRVEFVQTRVVDDWRRGTPEEERYEAGRVYDLPERSALRWIGRGDARAAPAELRVVPAAAPARGFSRPRARS